MNYLGITFKTVEWLLSNTKLLESFKEDFNKVYYEKSLNEGVIVAGPIRITCTDANLICVWNNDYLSGTDTEDWGFVKLINDFGVMEDQSMYKEVLERCLNLISLRLQGFNLPDDRFIHRVIGENIHTCLAGRGDIARKNSLGWYEDQVTSSKGSFHSLLIVGPSSEDLSRKPNNFTITLTKLKPILPKLIDSANDVLVKARQRPVLENKYFVEFRNRNIDLIIDDEMPQGDKELEENKVSNANRFTSLDWTYFDWINPGNTLTTLQREIFNSDVILRQPLRIVGAAGTGKTLLMQLLAFKRLEGAKANQQSVSLFYVVHNNEMVINITEKFKLLGANDYLNGSGLQKLVIKTLFEYACEELNLDNSILIDRDASQTKLFQRMAVTEFIEEIIRDKPNIVNKSDLIKKISENFELRDVFADIVVSEIGIGIKGRDLSNDKRKYIEAEKPLTRFHGILSGEEREFIYEIFTRYNGKILLKDGLLDSDDIAISFLGLLKTPLWNLEERKKRLILFLLTKPNFLTKMNGKYSDF